jgi:translocation and assembly module TamB
VPETGLGNAPPIPDIRHVGETAPNAAHARRRVFWQRARQAKGGSVGRGSRHRDQRTGPHLPARARHRRGIRRRIRIAGNSAAVIPSGQFDLIRGRISILGTRLDLTEGSATLQGDFDPFLRLRAESRAGGYRIIIAVDGPASAPDISLSSDPFLPEDEILAQLLFGRSVSALSPVQLLQLADAASSLAGGSTNGGILSNLREGLGLDDLDLETDDEGNAAVRAGRYLSDNVYTDVTVGAGGESELSLNIDLTPDITARGSFSSDGSSGIGVFFERDY